MMMSIDATIVATALHALEQDLGASINWTSWVITAYWFGYVVMLPVSGRLSERYGHRRVFLLSTLAFAAASLACGLADSIYALVLFRALQSAGGAGLTPAATGIIVTWFGPSRDRALGLFGAVFPVGAMIGPLFGGLFVTYASWRDVFFVNVPLGALAALLGLWLIPRDRAVNRLRGRTDVPGMCWLGLAVIGGMLAASTLGDADARLASWRFLLPAATSLLCGRQFFRHIRQTAAPFLEPRLIYGPGFGATNVLNAAYAGATAGAITLVPLYATSRYGLSALDSGTLLIAEAIAAITLSTLAAYLLRLSGYRLPFYVGGTLTALGLLLLVPGPPGGIPAYAWLATAAALIGAGAGIMSPASRNACLQLVPRQASTMAALRATAQELGVIVALAAATATMARTSEPTAALAHIYLVLALVCLVVLPLVRRVPEHRGAW
ncbi:MFS transporter [Castellaniella caeni]